MQTPLISDHVHMRSRPGDPAI